MKQETSNVAPRAQCATGYETDPEILDKVCHHCGRAICTEHQPTPIWGERFWDKSGMANPEYTYLWVYDEWIQPAIHCAGCAKKYHRKRHLWRVLGWLLQNDWLEKHLYLGKDRPPVPLTPTIRDIEIVETINGQIKLDATGQYSGTTTADPTGELKFALQFTERDQKVWEYYRFHYGANMEQPATRFHAGFVIPTSTENVCFRLDEGSMYSQVGVLELTDQIGNQPYFMENASSESASSSGLWPRSFPYTIVRGDQKPVPLPIRLIPTIIPDGTNSSLEVTLQLDLNIGLPAEFEVITVDELILWAPLELENTVQRSPPAAVNNEAESCTKEKKLEVKWRGLSLTKENPQLSMRVRYAKELTPATIIQGKVQVTLAGSLSALKEMYIYYPWGVKRKKQTARRRTVVKIDCFEISLGSLRFQQLYRASLLQHEHRGLALDYQLINQITEQLNQREIYVHSVVENPPRPDRINAQVTHRAWSISGRRYLNIHPIDIHLTLTSEDVTTRTRNNPGQLTFTPSPDAAAGLPSHRDNQVQVEATIQSYAPQPEIRQEVESLRHELESLLRTILP